MLSEYIDNYIKALDDNDEKSIKRIERELAMLGMDRYTLQIIVAERRKNSL